MPKRKRTKDPNAPKRPPSAYVLWSNDNRSVVKEDFPELKPKEVVGKLGELWQKVTDADKQRYNDKAKELRVVYAEERAKYEAKKAEEEANKPETTSSSDSSTGPVREEPPKKKRKKSKAKATEAERPTKKIKKPRMRRHPDAPKKPRNAYQMYLADTEMRDTIRADNADADNKTIKRIMEQAWKTLDDEAKQKFKDLAEKDKERYEQDKRDYDGPLEIRADKLAVKGVRRKRRRRPEGAPKPAKNAYSLFIQDADQRNAVMAKYEMSDSTTDIICLMAKHWKTMGEDEKAPYKEAARADRKRYAREKAVYVPPSLSESSSTAETENESDSEGTLRKKRDKRRRHREERRLAREYRLRNAQKRIEKTRKKALAKRQAMDIAGSDE